MLKERVKRFVLERARPVRCELCDGILFKGWPIIWRGRVKVLGAERALVRVDFESMNQLAFRHVEADACPPLRRDP